MTGIPLDMVAAVVLSAARAFTSRTGRGETSGVTLVIGHRSADQLRDHGGAASAPDIGPTVPHPNHGPGVDPAGSSADLRGAARDPVAPKRFHRPAFDHQEPRRRSSRAAANTSRSSGNAQNSQVSLLGRFLILSQARLQGVPLMIAKSWPG